MFAHHTQGLAECAAPRDTDVSRLVWGPGAQGLVAWAVHGIPRAQQSHGERLGENECLQELIQGKGQQW